MTRRKRKPLDSLGESAKRTLMREVRKLAKQSSSVEEFERLSQIALSAFEEAIPKTLQESAVPIADVMDTAMLGVVSALRRDERGFQRRLHRDWREALDRLRALVHAFYEFGAKLHEDNGHPDADAPSVLTTALLQLQARACRMAREVLHLLEGGYADGALARWRTLHEITIVAEFLREHGEPSAERYLLHDAVRAYRTAEIFEKHAVSLGWESIPEAELAELRTTRDQLCSQFGPSFGTEYGWATDILPGNPGIRQIEENIQLAHWRPFYRWASEGVHAGPGGLRPLGLHLMDDSVLLTGPSNAGLADPAQNTALSLSHFAATLASHRPTMDVLAMTLSFKELSSRCVAAFVEASERMEDVQALEAESPDGGIA